MPILIILESGHKPRLFELKQDTLRIGRASDNDLVLANVSISRHHAELSRGKSAAAVLTPTAENNPVLINDVEISTATTLQHGDNVRLGKFKLTWRHEDQMEMYELHKLSELPLFHSLAEGNTEHQTHALPASLQRKLIEYELLRERGGLTGEDGLQIRLGTNIAKIGPDDAIPCASRWGKRTAATIEWSGNGHMLTTTGFLAKVTVNGEAIQSHILRRGDEISVNGTTFTYGKVKRAVTL